MSHSQPELSIGPSNQFSFLIPSLFLLGALILMGTWMISSTSDSPPVATQPPVSIDLAEAQETVASEESSGWVIANASDIPFPLYPNATRYRIGGQNGLKLALFETTDEFVAVDRFYNEKARSADLARRLLLPDFVRYSSEADLASIPAEDYPGVFIHAFFDADEVDQAGASIGARTNIIISYR